MVSRVKNMDNWNPNEKPSAIWYLLGFIGVGNLVALIYTLIADKKNRLFGLLFLVGIIGNIVIYLMFKQSDKKLAGMALDTLVGGVVLTVVLLLVFVLNI